MFAVTAAELAEHAAAARPTGEHMTLFGMGGIYESCPVGTKYRWCGMKLHFWGEQQQRLPPQSRNSTASSTELESPAVRYAGHLGFLGAQQPSAHRAAMPEP